MLQVLDLVLNACVCVCVCVCVCLQVLDLVLSPSGKLLLASTDRCVSLGLFCHIHRALLPHTQGSFATYTGLLCHIHRALLPHTQGSFSIYTELFYELLARSPSGKLFRDPTDVCVCLSVASVKP